MTRQANFSSTLFLAARIFFAVTVALPPVDSHASPSLCNRLLLRVHDAFWGVPSPRRAPVSASAPLLELLEKKSLQDPEIVRLFTRHPELPGVNPHYLQNMADSIRESFAPWFEHLSTESFESMLKMQHAILTRGIEGTRPYRSTSTSSPMKRRTLGTLRYSSPPVFSQMFLDFTLQDFLMGPGDCQEFLQRFLENQPDFLRYQPEIERIPTLHRPRAKLSIFRHYGPVGNFTFRMTYPTNIQSRHYVAALGAVMESLRELPVPASREALFPLLADYVQLFSTGLPFERVNFSIAMGQVNYILMKHGFRGVENGELDLYSAMLSTQDFRKLFGMFVEHAQP